MTLEKDDLLPICSFCGRYQSEVNTLVRGINAHICDGCINVCIYAFRDKGFLDQLPELENIDTHLKKN